MAAKGEGHAFEGERAKFLVSITDEWGVWHRAEPFISSCFPMRDVHWIEDQEFRTAVNVACLDVQILPDTSKVIDRGAHPSLWWTRPFLHVFLAKCEEAAIYKDGVQQRMRSWVIEREAAGEEYLVIYLPLGSAKSSSTYMYLTSPSSVVTGESTAGKLYRKLLDKMRSDVKQADKVLVFDLSIQSGAAGAAHEHAAHEAKLQMGFLAAKLKESLLNSIGARFTEYEELIAMAHVVARQAEGWDFSAAFAPRDAMALMYKSMGALELSHRQYRAWHEYFDEFVVGDAPRFPYFEPRGVAEGSHLADPLDIFSRRHYIELASGGMLSEFEFRLFVLGREVRLDADAGRLSQAARLALEGIKQLAAEASARKDKQGVSPLFPHSVMVCCAEWCARDLHRRIDAAKERAGADPFDLDRRMDAAKERAGADPFDLDRRIDAAKERAGADPFAASQASAAHCAVAELYLMAARSASLLLKPSSQLKAAYKRLKKSSSTTPIMMPVVGGSSRELPAETQRWGQDGLKSGAGKETDPEQAAATGAFPRNASSSSSSWLPTKVSSLISVPAHGGVSRALSTLRKIPSGTWEKDILTQSFMGAYNRGIASFPFQDMSFLSAAPSSAAAAPTPSSLPAPPATHVAPTLLFQVHDTKDMTFATEHEEDRALEQMQSGPLLDAIICGDLEDYWLSLTSAARDHLVAGGRPRSANFLALELAEAHMQQKRWGEAGELLRYAFEQLISDSWSPLIGQVFDPLCKCLENLGERAARLALSLALLSCQGITEPSLSNAVSILKELPSRLEVEGLVHELGPLISVALRLPSPPDLPGGLLHEGDLMGHGERDGDDQVELDLGDGIVVTSNRVLLQDEDASDDRMEPTWDTHQSQFQASEVPLRTSPSSSLRNPHGRRHLVPVGCDVVIECTLDSRLPCELEIDAVTLALVPQLAESSAPQQKIASTGSHVDRSVQGEEGANAITKEREIVLQTVLEAAGRDDGQDTGLFLLEKKRIVLRPGRNVVTLSAPMLQEGEFMLTALTLRCGKLILAHSLRGNGSAIVEGRRGIPTAHVGIVKGDGIVRGVPTLAKVVIHAHEGGASSPLVRVIGTSEGTSVFPRVSFTTGAADGCSRVESKQHNFVEIGEDGWVQLPNLESGKIVTACFVLLSGDVDVDCETQTHLIFQADVTYRGVQGAIYDIRREVRLMKVPAFTLQKQLLANPCGGSLLKLDLTCNAELHRFNVLDEHVSVDGQLFGKSNLSERSSRSIGKGQEVHLVYSVPCSLLHESNLENCKLKLKFSSTWTDPAISQIAGMTSDDRSIDISFTLSDAHEPAMCVRMTSPTIGFVGRPITATVWVEGMESSSRFSFADHPAWLFGGQIAGQLEASFSFTLIPLKGGMLQLPHILVDRPVKQVAALVLVLSEQEFCCLPE